MAASGDRAQEAWSAVACALRNVLAPVWLLRLRNQGNLTQQPSVCFRSVWGSCANRACLKEPRLGQGEGKEGEAACPFTLPLSPSSRTAAQGSILSVLPGPGLMGGPQSCASLGRHGESRYVWPLSSEVHWEEPPLRRQPGLVWILVLLLTSCVALG